MVAQIDSEMAGNAKAVAAATDDDWERLLAEGIAYINMALVPEVQRIVLLDGPAVLGDPAQWPSQNSCLESTRQTIEKLIERNVLKNGCESRSPSVERRCAECCLDDCRE